MVNVHTQELPQSLQNNVQKSKSMSQTIEMTIQNYFSLKVFDMVDKCLEQEEWNAFAKNVI